MTSCNTCKIGFFQLKNKSHILSKTKSEGISMCEHPTHQVNVSRKEFCERRILTNFLRHPVFSLSIQNQTIPSGVQILIRKNFDVNVTVKYSSHFRGGEGGGGGFLWSCGGT